MAAALALMAAALFGAALITTQFGLRHMDALAGATLSVPSATLVFWLILPWRGFDGWNASGAAVFIALGSFFPVAVTLLAYEANRRLGPTIAGAIGSSAPLFAVLGAALFLGEMLRLPQIAATLAIVAGSIALAWQGGACAGERRDAVLVSWVAWLAAAVRALAQLVAKVGLLLWPDPYAAVVLSYSVSSVAIWIIAAASRRPRGRVYDRRGAGWFVATGMFNGGAVMALYSALDVGTVNIVSPIAATYPLFSLLINAVWLREERLSARLCGGIALMVGGVAALWTF